MIAYFNAVSSAPPPRTADTYTVSPVCIALAVEDDGKIVRTVLRQIAPAEGVRIDLGWCSAYGSTMPEDVELPSAVTVANEVADALVGVDTIAAHFTAFHRRQFESLMAADAIAPPALQWVCTMMTASAILKIPASRGSAWKPPRLGEAVHGLTGEELPAIGWLPWREAQLATLTAIRRVHRAVCRIGLAEPVVEVAP